jgi:large subunit ribosomal protein L25
MSDAIEIVASARDRAGKGAARQARRDGLVPAVIYGGKKQPAMITLPVLVVNRLLRDPAFFTHIYSVKTDDKRAEKVMARDVQLHPVRDEALHIDFLRVSESTMVDVDVPVEFLNFEDSPGGKEGGVLNVVRHEVSLRAPAGSIPEKIEVDLAAVEMGDTIHISAVTLPAKCEPTITDRDFTIASIAAPSGLAAADEEEEEAAEA